MTSKNLVYTILFSSVFALSACQPGKKAELLNLEGSAEKVEEKALKVLSASEKKLALQQAEQTFQLYKTIHVQANAQNDLCFQSANSQQAILVKTPFTKSFQIYGDQDSSCAIQLSLQSKLLHAVDSQNLKKQTTQLKLDYGIVHPDTAFNFTYRSAQLTGSSVLSGIQNKNNCSLNDLRTLKGDYTLNDSTAVHFELQNQLEVSSQVERRSSKEMFEERRRRSTREAQRSVSDFADCDFSYDQDMNLVADQTLVKKSYTQTVYLKALGAEVKKQQIFNQKRIVLERLWLNGAEVSAEEKASLLASETGAAE